MVVHKTLSIPMKLYEFIEREIIKHEEETGIKVNFSEMACELMARTLNMSLPFGTFRRRRKEYQAPYRDEQLREARELGEFAFKCNTKPGADAHPETVRVYEELLRNSTQKHADQLRNCAESATVNAEGDTPNE